MIETKKITKPVLEVTAYICDLCHKRITQDDFWEFQEMIHISHDCGYGSVFGDGAKLRVDVCQYCFKEWIER